MPRLSFALPDKESGKSVKYVWLPVCLFLLAVVPPFWAIDPPGFPFHLKLVFLLAIAAVSLPFIFADLRERDRPVPMLQLIAGFYLVFFLLPPFFIDRAWFQFRPAIPQGFLIGNVDVRHAVVAVGGSLVLLGTFFLSGRLLRDRIPALPLPKDDPPELARVLALVLCTIHVFTLYVPVLQSIPSVGQLVDPLGYLGFGLALLLFLERRLSIWETVYIFYVLVAAKIFWHVFFGLFTPCVILLLYLAVLKPSLDRTRLLMISLPAVLTIAIVLSSRTFIDTYRQEMLARVEAPLTTSAQDQSQEALAQDQSQEALAQDQSQEAVAQGPPIVHGEPKAWMRSPLDSPASPPAAATNEAARPSALNTFLERAMLNQRVEVFSRSFSSYLYENDFYRFACKFLRRIGLQSATLSHAILFTPNMVPYWEGTTYRSLLSNNIPRLLWPEKPEERIGQSFGHRYRILWPTDSVTSWNLPWLTETFVNFGLGGTLLGMALIGFFVSLIDRVFNRTDMGLCGTAVGCALVFPLFYQESNISLMLGNFLVIAASLIGLCLLAWSLWFGRRIWREGLVRSTCSASRRLRLRLTGRARIGPIPESSGGAEAKAGVGPPK